VALTELDRSLIQQCLAQEPGAWRNFVDRYIGLFVHVIQHTAHARSVPVSEADVDDLCSDILLAVLQDQSAVLRNFRGESSLATYLAVVARRVVIREMIQRRMSEALGHVKAHQDSVEQAHQDQAHYDPQRIENAELVRHMLDGLPEAEAAVVRQFHLEGKSYVEISQGLKIPENSIGPMLSRAREKLRRTLASAG
jgi:RNA polymerase sigma-70 factor, ECF subfamily